MGKRSEASERQRVAQMSPERLAQIINEPDFDDLEPWAQKLLTERWDFYKTPQGKSVLMLRWAKQRRWWVIAARAVVVGAATYWMASVLRPPTKAVAVAKTLETKAPEMTELDRILAEPIRDFVRIKSCYDGDTCTTTDGEKIRLACIDAPEMNEQTYEADLAKRTLNNLTKGAGVVQLERINVDRYGRTVGELYSNKGMNIGQEMVERKLAWVHGRYAHQCPWAR